MTDSPGPADLIILVPVYNDWAAFGLLLRQLDEVAAGLPMRTRVLAVDDGSTDPPPASISPTQLAHLASVEILALRRNLGHQRAIAVGLCYVEANRSCQAVVVMDGDGEDAPGDIPRLLKAFEQEGGARLVFAERTKRSESWVFRLFYHLYRVLHLLLTGVAVRVGNFSVMPPGLLSQLVVVSDLWNHYAASVMKARIPFTTVPTVRASRLAGRSRMNFVALVTHGLSAISVFGDRVGVRLLVVVAILMALTVAGLVATVVIRLATDLAIPGWATQTSGLLLVVLIQTFVMTAIFVFFVLGSREGSTFLPVRDHVYFVAGARRGFPSDE